VIVYSIFVISRSFVSLDNGLMKSPNQHVLIIGMGGTIAGLAQDPDNPSAYCAGQVSLASLIPTEQSDAGFAHGDIRTQQLANIDSRDLSEALLTQLGLAVRAALDNPDVLGVLVTHGTDTIEETGIFLDAVCSKQAERLGKRVILTGAMLPSNHPQADGPLNLQAALRWAQMDLETCPAGVFGIFAGRVCLARDLAKRHTSDLNAPLRDSPSSPVHLINPSWLSRIRRIQADLGQDMAIPPEDGWPWVEILTSHAGAKPETVLQWLNQPIQGLVIAGTGMGGVHAAWHKPLRDLAEKGVAMVKASRVGAGHVHLHLPEADPANWVAAGSLSSPKARIALQLALYAAFDAKQGGKSMTWQDFFARIAVLPE
jgi:L-asparaginase